MLDRADELQEQASLAAEAGEYAAALPLYRDALTALRERPLVEEDRELFLLSRIGHAAQRGNELDVARKHHEEALRLVRRAPEIDRRRLAYILHDLGDTHIQRGETVIARIYLTESADIFVALREYDDAAHVLDDLADFAVDNEDWDEAGRRLHDCLEMARRDANPYRQIRALFVLAVVAAKQNAPDSSEGYFAEAQRLLTENAAFVSGECRLLILRAHTSEKLHKTETATYWEQALEAARQQGELRLVERILYDMGCHSLTEKRMADADAQFAEAAEIQRQVAPDSLYRSLWMRGNIAGGEGRYLDAEAHYRAALCVLPQPYRFQDAATLLYIYATLLPSDWISLRRMATLFGALEKLLAEAGTSEWRDEWAHISRVHFSVQFIFRRHWRAGRALSLTEAISLATIPPPRSWLKKFLFDR